MVAVVVPVVLMTIAEAVRPGGKTLLLPVRFGSAPASLPAIAKAHRVAVGSNEGDWTMYVWVDDVMVSATSSVDLGEADVTYDFGPSPKLPLEDIKRLLAGVTVASPL